MYDIHSPYKMIGDSSIWSPLPDEPSGRKQISTDAKISEAPKFQQPSDGVVRGWIPKRENDDYKDLQYMHDGMRSRSSLIEETIKEHLASFSKIPDLPNIQSHRSVKHRPDKQVKYVLGWTHDPKIKTHYSVEYYPDHDTVYVNFYTARDSELFDIGDMLILQYGTGTVEVTYSVELIWMTKLRMQLGRVNQPDQPVQAPTRPPVQAPTQPPVHTSSQTSIDFEAIYRKYCESASRPAIDMESVRGSTRLRNFIDNITSRVYSAGRIQQICEWMALHKR